MSAVARYRCHQCGAPYDGRATEGWLRCGFCRVYIAFDWQGYLASDGYAAFIRQAASPEHLARSQRLVETRARGEALTRADDPAARQAFLDAAAALIDLTPAMYPSQIGEDVAYRARWVAHLGETLWLTARDPELRQLDESVQRILREISWAEPLPTLKQALELVRAQARRLDQARTAPDPDGMPPDARLRASLTQFVGGFAQVVGGAAVEALLVEVLGQGAVAVGVDGGGLYRDWSCPACGLVSLQARAALEDTCPGCLLRQAAGDDSVDLPAMRLRCTSCGADAELRAGERSAACAYCRAAIRRLDRDYRVERKYAGELRDQIAAEAGIALSTAAQPGLPVDDRSRDRLRQTGLYRQLLWYGKLVPMARLAALAHQSFGPLDAAGVQALLVALDEIGAVEQQPLPPSVRARFATAMGVAPSC